MNPYYGNAAPDLTAQQPVQRPDPFHATVPLEPLRPTARQPVMPMQGMPKQTAPRQGYPQQSMPQPAVHYETAQQPFLVNGWTSVNAENFGNEAPELLEERSANLLNDDATFWQTAKQTAKKQGKGGGRKKTVIGIAGLLLAAFAAMVFFGNNFVCRFVIDGETTYTEEQILTLAGLRQGMYSGSVSEEQIRKQFLQDPYLELRYLNRSESNEIHLGIYQRYPMTVVDYNGVSYLVDGSGIVLERLADGSTKGDGLVSFKFEGMTIRRCEPGYKLVLSDSSALKFYSDILVELKIMDKENLVTLVDASDRANIYLETRGDFSVRFGDQERIHAKIRTTLAAVERSAAQQLGNCTVDVSNPDCATYIPSSAQF